MDIRGKRQREEADSGTKDKSAARIRAALSFFGIFGSVFQESPAFGAV